MLVHVWKGTDDLQELIRVGLDQDDGVTPVMV